MEEKNHTCIPIMPYKAQEVPYMTDCKEYKNQVKVWSVVKLFFLDCT